MADGLGSSAERDSIRSIEIATARGDFAGACKLVDTAAREFAENAEIWAILAETLLLRARLKDAQEAVRKARELRPDSALSWASEAALAHVEGRYDNARAAAARALEIDNTHPLVLRAAIGFYCRVLGDLKEALALASRWRELHPSDDLATSTEVSMMLKLKGRAEGERLLAEAEERFPDSSLLLGLRSRMLAMRSRHTQSLEALRQAAARLEGNAELSSSLATRLAIDGDAAEAEQYLNKALDIAPGSFEVISDAVSFYRHQGRIRDLDRLRCGASISVPAMREWLALSEAQDCILRRQLDRALQLADEGLSARDWVTRQSAAGVKVAILMQNNRLDEAERLIDQMIPQGYDAGSVSVLKATLLAGKGNPQEQVVFLQDAVQKEPDSYDLRFRLLEALHKTGDHEQKQAQVDYLLLHLPEDPMNLALCASTLAAVGYPDEAKRVLRTGLERFPDSKALRLHAATDKIEAGDMAAMKEALTMMKQMHPGAIRSLGWVRYLLWPMVWIMSIVSKILPAHLKARLRG